MPYPFFDRSRLHLLPLAERQHDIDISNILGLDYLPSFNNDNLVQVADRIVRARRVSKQVILVMGAHVIKQGLSRFVIDLMERGIITHLAMNGAGVIHDYELALIGATSESVARYIQEGQFGLWLETGQINDLVAQGISEEMGIGEAVGRAIESQSYPHRDISLLAAGYRLRIPVTAHIGIGYDIIHEHPNFDGAAFGAASYRDFLIFANSVSALQDGVLMNFGTSVMGPEVYLKALSMSRNVAYQENRQINHFSTALFDLVDLGEDIHHEAAKSKAQYYFRPFKTILIRTVQDGGESFYIQGDHRETLPNLRNLVIQMSTSERS